MDFQILSYDFWICSKKEKGSKHKWLASDFYSVYSVPEIVDMIPKYLFNLWLLVSKNDV